MARGRRAEEPAGRKRKIAEKDGEEEGELDELACRWEWEGDGGVWNVYSDEHAQDISQALWSGNTSVRLSLAAKTTLQVDLKKMIQKNSQTGFERSIRYAVKDQEDYFVWQWQDDDALWHPYSASVCVDLERARIKGEGTATLAIGRVRYTLDIGRMRQVNGKTKFERKMSRVQSDGAGAVVPKGGSQPAAVSAEASSSASGSTTAKKPRKNSKKQSENEASSSQQAGGDSQETVKTVIVKGKAAMDSECQAKQGKAHVYCEGDDVYDTLLNQTNLQHNNNKYYIIQLLEDDAKRNFSVWLRWGRVGKAGQNNLISCGTDLDKAKEIFEKKFLDKTKNDWSMRAFFEKVAGKYDILSRDYSGDAPADKELGEAAKAPNVESKLDRQVQELMELICNIQAMEEMVLQMKYDTKKAPLGKLTTAQIKAGYISLQKIESCINRNMTGKALVEACNEFYTRIPHDFGLKTPPLIKSKKELQEKMELLEALSDIEVAIKVVKSDLKSTENPLDRQYHSLQCSLQPLEHTAQQFKVIEKYLQSTHASTHQDYTMKLLEVFDMEKEGEGDLFRTDLDNRQLLWHGSRLTNWVSILKQGLRIAPPEAPVTGYMFGKGIYFADMSSKSANYCFATRERNVGLLLLCEVALGNCNKLLSADYEADKLPPGKDSTMGLGRIGPKPGSDVQLNGALVPMGPGTETGVENPNGYTLNYNEYIVYNPAQVHMKYLLKVQFDFASLW
ncbi:poly [ADP-ribose] polymerase 2 [Scyliorhinus canicula]|uniref:poly [ADP-ribose] polymerase 2 n=1 Tax=Scyliorhinus canicula TaxID=7830 RepID=UPI0018F5F25D|nr:poly [ADP-ribose] polymerase 2 [Scyliorhinus canicula]